jgi:hypothetical protein
MSTRAKSPFKCKKVFFYNKPPNAAITKVIENLKEKDYSKKDNEFITNIFSYIEKTQYAPTSFCEKDRIGMNTTGLCDIYNEDKVKGDIVYMICYEGLQPHSVLLFTYTHDSIFIEAVCADQQNSKSKGSGSLLLDDLIDAVRETDIKSIMLDSVDSAKDFYIKRGFIVDKKTANPDHDNPMILKFSEKSGGRNKKTYKLKKQRKLKKRTYKKQRGGRFKEMLCSQAIVSAARVKCVKTCKKKKEDMANEKEMAKLNKQYDAFLAKTCKADDYDCIQKHREGNPLFDQIIKLEAKGGKMRDACMKKHCSKDELNRLDHCIDLGEEQCRVKYADLIKKSKKKILPLADCLRNL